MNSAQALERSDARLEHPASQPRNDQRRIRQAMRVRPVNHRPLPGITVVRGATLIAGFFCLGWKASRLWRS